MNGCMIAHAGREEEDKAREEWFVGRQERREKREKEEKEVEVRRKEVLGMMEKDRREEEEKRRREGR
jgi:COX assembly mitochondrial protein 1